MKSRGSIETVLPLIRAGLYAMLEGERASGTDSTVSPRPFVTVSRQAGAGGRSFARSLVDRLQTADPGSPPWTSWDRELVTKVAEEQLIPAALTEQLERRRESPIERFVTSFLPHDDPAMFGQAEVYCRVAKTIRALARAGRVVVVGRGGVYATRDMPGGVHVRLVAPLDRRVSHMAAALGAPRPVAAAEVRRLDRERDAFHRRVRGARALLPEVFTITLNTAAMSTAQMIDCVLPLLVAKSPGRPAATPGLPAAPVPGGGAMTPSAGA